MKYKTIDLCAGIGGIRKGFEITEMYENVLSAEIDEYAAKTYEHLFNDDPRNDVTKREFKQKVSETEYDILLAGFPCQPFSRAGNMEGFDDPTQGTIFFHIKQIIKQTRPKAIFLENVQNLISHREGETIRIIIKILEKELNYKMIGVTNDGNGGYGYSQSSFVRNTANFGLPQNRPRAYIMAFDRDLYGDALDKLDNKLPEKREGAEIFPDVNSIMEHEADIHYYMSASYLRTLEMHKKTQKEKGNGFGYCIVNDPSRQSNIANTILATGGSGRERNLLVQPMPEFNPEDSIVKRKKGGINTQNVRIMTPTEWGRLQGFIGYAFINSKTGIDEFSFPKEMPESQQYKQFGNAVSIPVVEEMARFMMQCFVKLNQEKETIVKRVVQNRGYITRRMIMDIFKVNGSQSSYILKKLIQKNVLVLNYKGRNSKYEIYPEEQ